MRLDDDTLGTRSHEMKQKILGSELYTGNMLKSYFLYLYFPS